VRVATHCHVLFAGLFLTSSRPCHIPRSHTLFHSAAPLSMPGPNDETAQKVKTRTASWSKTIGKNLFSQRAQKSMQATVSKDTASAKSTAGKESKEVAVKICEGVEWATQLPLEQLCMSGALPNDDPCSEHASNAHRPPCVSGSCGYIPRSYTTIQQYDECIRG